MNAPPGFDRLIGIDVDGDGLTDLLLTQAAFQRSDWQPYLSALDSQGVVQPFAERGEVTCIPHHNSSNAQMRLMADFDGDGLTDLIEIEGFPNNPPGSTFDHSYLDVRVWKSRGDGRFGLGVVVGQRDPCNQLAGHEVLAEASVCDSSSAVGREKQRVM